MAKIDTLKFIIDGKEYTSNVNVRKDGTFAMSLHWQVKNALGLNDYPETSATKNALVNPVYEAYREYLKAKITYELYIAIEYKASGEFFKDADGNLLDDVYRSDFYENDFSSNGSKLIFGFKVYCKQISSTGVETWRETKKSTEENDRHFKNVDNIQKVGDYYATGTTYSVKGIIIPYTKKAVETLQKAEDGIKNISGILYHFLNQDTQLISAQLSSGNLLGT